MKPFLFPKGGLIVKFELRGMGHRDLALGAANRSFRAEYTGTGTNLLYGSIPKAGDMVVWCGAARESGTPDVINPSEPGWWGTLVSRPDSGQVAGIWTVDAIRQEEIDLGPVIMNDLDAAGGVWFALSRAGNEWINPPVFKTDIDWLASASAGNQGSLTLDATSNPAPLLEMTWAHNSGGNPITDPTVNTLQDDWDTESQGSQVRCRAWMRIVDKGFGQVVFFKMAHSMPLKTVGLTVI
jgi:hypothetical protein